MQRAVDTANSQTLGQLADAAETRRIVPIAIIDRTAQEHAHMKDSPPAV